MCHGDYCSHRERELVANGDVNQDAEHGEQAGDDRGPHDFSADSGPDLLQAELFEPGRRKGLHQLGADTVPRAVGRSDAQGLRAAGHVALELDLGFRHAEAGDGLPQLVGFHLLGETENEVVAARKVNAEHIPPAVKYAVA